MARMVHCIKLDKEAEGLDFPPYPGEMGKKIWETVSKEAWAAWLKHQTMLVNENRLNLADARARKYLATQMERHFFGDGAAKCKDLLSFQDNASFDPSFTTSACYMAEITHEIFTQKNFKGEDVAYFEPFYLKDFYSPAHNSKA